MDLVRLNQVGNIFRQTQKKKKNSIFCDFFLLIQIRVKLSYVLSNTRIIFHECLCNNCFLFHSSIFMGQRGQKDNTCMSGLITACQCKKKHNFFSHIRVKALQRLAKYDLKFICRPLNTSSRLFEISDPSFHFRRVNRESGNHFFVPQNNGTSSRSRIPVVRTRLKMLSLCRGSFFFTFSRSPRQSH